MMSVSSDPLPPAQPSYILRGHQSQIHSLSFYAGNTRLLSGDGDGYVISWDVVTKRPVAGWRAHKKALVGLCAWSTASASSRQAQAQGPGQAQAQPQQSFSKKPQGLQQQSEEDGIIITHGRDGRLAVWRLDSATERLMHQYVPAEQLQEVTAKPAILAEIEVGTVSFCGFASCRAPLDMAFASLSLGNDRPSNSGPHPVPPATPSSEEKENEIGQRQVKRTEPFAPSWSRTPLLVAVPSASGSEDIDVFYLPSCVRKTSIKSPTANRPGMLMALVLSCTPENEGGDLTLAAGHENGEVLIYQHKILTDSWETIYRARAHSQPVLSLTLHPARRVCISSGADAILARHPFGDRNLLESSGGTKPLKVVNTGHAGLQGLAMRDDGKIFSAAGWDTRVRVYSAKTMKEVAVLKVHKQGCYATAFADVNDTNTEERSHHLSETGKTNKLSTSGNLLLRLDRLNRKYKLKVQAEDKQSIPPLVPVPPPLATPPNSQEEALLWDAINEKISQLQTQNPGRLHQVLDEYEDWATKRGLDDDDDNQAQKTLADLGLLPSTNNHAQRLLDLLLAVDDGGGAKKVVSKLKLEPKLKMEQGGEQGEELSRRDDSGAEILVPATPEKSRAMARYEKKVTSTHWLAAGSKDGNISLWDIF